MEESTSKGTKLSSSKISKKRIYLNCSESLRAELVIKNFRRYGRKRMVLNLTYCLCFSVGRRMNNRTCQNNRYAR